MSTWLFLRFYFKQLMAYNLDINQFYRFFVRNCYCYNNQSMQIDNSEDYPPFPEDYPEAHKMIKKCLRFNQYRSPDVSLNNSRLTQIQQRASQRIKNDSIIYQLNFIEDTSSVKIQDQRQMNKNNENSSIKKTMKLKNKLNQQLSISVDETCLKYNSHSNQWQKFNNPIYQSESQIYQKDNLKQKIDKEKRRCKEYDSDSSNLEQNVQNHESQDGKENTELQIQFAKEMTNFSHRLKELLQKRIIQTDAETKNIDFSSQNYKAMLKVTNSVHEKCHKPYFGQSSHQERIQKSKSPRSELKELQQQQNQIKFKFDKLASNLNQKLKNQTNQHQENHQNDTFCHQIVIDQSSELQNHFDHVDLDNQNSFRQTKKIESYNRRMNFTSKSYKKFVEEFDSCIQIVQIRSKKNVNQYLWKMGNIKLWASLGSAIQKNFELYMANAKKYQRMFNKYLEYEENRGRQKAEYQYEDYLSKPKKMTLKKQQKYQKFKGRSKDCLKSEIVLQKHAFNKVLVNKVMQFERQIARNGKQQVIVQREQDKFSQFLPEADEIELLIEDLINKSPEEQMKNNINDQKKLKRQPIKREIKRPEFPNKRNNMVSKIKQIARNVNYSHQINNLFILSNRESFDKVACYLNKLRSQNQVEIVDRQTFYKDVSLSKNNRQKEFERNQQSFFPLCIDLTR